MPRVEIYFENMIEDIDHAKRMLTVKSIKKDKTQL